MTRLSINIKEGTLEVEGEESFVRQVYTDFKEQVASHSSPPASAPPASSPQKELSSNEDSMKSTVKKQQRKSRGTKSKDSLSIVKDLDLSAKSNPQSLRDFYAKKSPTPTSTSAMEKNAIFVYYLQMIAKIDAITLDHVYSCYKDVSVKYPSALRQSLKDTAFHKGYIDTASFDSIKLATPGENFVEHDLPKAVES
jgi:hypothetical protein